MSTQPASCRRCARELVPVAEWRTMPKEERKAAGAAGKRRAGSRGLCAACHQWVRSNPETASLEDYAPLRLQGAPPSTWVLCRRCGAEHGDGGRLCADCLDVVHDLAEARAWVS